MENTSNHIDWSVVLSPAKSRLPGVSFSAFLSLTVCLTLGLTVELSAQPTPASAAGYDVGTGPLAFEAGEGTVARPFVITNGYVYQPFTTSGATNGGRVSYSFRVTHAGAYVIQALVNAPDEAEHSFYVNIDSEPLDESMVWSLPVTAGFEERFITWRIDEGGFTRRPACKVFDLPEGPHQLIIRGKGAGTQLNRLVISRLASPPTGWDPVAPQIR